MAMIQPEYYIKGKKATTKDKIAIFDVLKGCIVKLPEGVAYAEGWSTRRVLEEAKKRGAGNYLTSRHVESIRLELFGRVAHIDAPTSSAAPTKELDHLLAEQKAEIERLRRRIVWLEDSVNSTLPLLLRLLTDLAGPDDQYDLIDGMMIVSTKRR